MNSQVVRQEMRDFVVSNFLFGMGEVDSDASLMAEGITDSTGVLELVMFVEEHFDITVADDEVIPENFDSIDALTDYVSSKVKALPAALAS